MPIETGIGLFFVAMLLVVFFLVWRQLRAEEKWREHRSRHEVEEETQLPPSERQW